MKLKIETGISNKILRKKSKPIKSGDISNIEKLISDMIDTMYEDDGIGLAAPQIGKNIQLCIIGNKVTPDEKDLILINPKITFFGKKTEVLEEGCLSLPDIFGDVERSVKIRVKAKDQNGKEVIIKAKGLFARVIQHEIDHLNGILFMDKIKI
ncbi:MAG: peptide deformylase [Patescibacteria group bacterium]